MAGRGVSGGSNFYVSINSLCCFWCHPTPYRDLDIASPFDIRNIFYIFFGIKSINNWGDSIFLRVGNYLHFKKFREGEKISDFFFFIIILMMKVIILTKKSLTMFAPPPPSWFLYHTEFVCHPINMFFFSLSKELSPCHVNV